MSNVRFIGCLHLGHEWMAKYRGFNCSEEHDNFLITSWNKVINKKDLTFILGDVTMEKTKYYPLLDQLNGRKIVVLGNHDLCKDIPELLNHVESVAGMIDYKGFCLTHAPIHPNEIIYYRGNIHAHIHQGRLSETVVKGRDNVSLEKTLEKYINVDAKEINFIPKTIEELTHPLLVNRMLNS